MKRLFTSAIAIVAICLSASAQEAFKHVSVGLEVGTTGIGLEAGLPIVSNHLVLKAGYNFGNFGASVSGNLDVNDFSKNVNGYVSDANAYLAQIPGESARLQALPSKTDVTATASVKAGAFKAMLEYYPSKNSGFHITAGIYAGPQDILSLDGNIGTLWNTYETDRNTADELCDKYPGFKALVGDIPDLTATIEGNTYTIKSPGNVNVGLQVASVRPYLGIGFGRSIPDTHFGFQFDLGAAYMGKTAVTSNNKVTYDKNAYVVETGDQFSKIVGYVENYFFYPQLSFRLIYRIF